VVVDDALVIISAHCVIICLTRRFIFRWSQVDLIPKTTNAYTYTRSDAAQAAGAAAHFFVFVFDLFSASWRVSPCVDPTTKGNKTSAPLLRGRPPSGPASTAFEFERQSRLAARPPVPLYVSCPLPLPSSVLVAGRWQFAPPPVVAAARPGAGFVCPGVGC
jgi:hypothetical protein